jgi:nucleotide-binding universal stress UspA family protein
MYTGLNALEEGVEEVLSRETPLAQHLKEAAQRAEESGVNAKIELRHGMVAEEILRACEMEAYDLVVIGSPDPRALLSRLTLGRVAPQLLASTPISILIVRSAVEVPA